MNSDNLKFISNNVKGKQKSEKRIKIFEYLKNSTSPSGFVFLQEKQKNIALLMAKKGGATSLMAVYIFLTEKLIRAV